MLRRSGFARKERPPRSPTVLSRGNGRGVIAQVGDEVCARPKEAPVRSEPYRRLVATLACDRCRIEGYTQAAHGDKDKGMGIKACDLTCYPACGPRPGTALVGLSPGCHFWIGSSGIMTRDERRAYEAEAAARTQRTLMLAAMSDHKVRKILQSVGLLP